MITAAGTVTSAIKDATPTLAEKLTSIKDSYSQYILQPSVAFGLAGFVFDIEGETAMQLQADITDHYIEDNSAIQDHISIKPLRVTLKNYVGELSYTSPSIGNYAQKVVTKLTNLTSYLPTVATAAQGAKNLFTKKDLSFNSGVNNIADLWSLAKNLNPTATKQQQAYQYFKLLMEQRILISLQTPFEFIQNMAIESLAATQLEDSVSISNFTITLKRLKFATSKKSVATINVSKEVQQGRQLLQAADVINKGKAVGKLVGAAI